MPKTATKPRSTATHSPARSPQPTLPPSPSYPPIAQVLSEMGITLPDAPGVIPCKIDPVSAEDEALLHWFLDRLPNAVPQPPFQLRPAVQVVGKQFYTRLEFDVRKAIENPAKCPRWRTGALQQDLRDLYKLMLEES